MTASSVPWAPISLVISFLAGLGGLFAGMAQNDTSDPDIWWWLTILSFALAGLILIVALVLSLLRWRRSKREQRFPPGQEPLMQTPPEHRTAPQGPFFDKEWADTAREREEAIYGPRTEWSFFHLAWPSELGGPTVWLEAHGPDNDHRANVWCLVRTPDGSSKERDMTDAFGNLAAPDRRVDVQWRFPQDFPGGSGATYIDEGKYEVEWRGEAGVGRDFLGKDCFLIANGEVHNCDGTPAGIAPEYD